MPLSPYKTNNLNLSICCKLWQQRPCYLKKCFSQGTYLLMKIYCRVLTRWFVSPTTTCVALNLSYTFRVTTPVTVMALGGISPTPTWAWYAGNIKARNICKLYLRKRRVNARNEKSSGICDAASMDMHGAFLLYYNLKTVTFDIPVV